MLIIKRISYHKYFFLFSLVYFILTLLTYKHFGVTFDEKVEYDSGRHLYSYYLKPSTIPAVHKELDNIPPSLEERQLPLFSVYSRIYPMILALINSKEYFEWFHMLNMFLGYFLFLFFYIYLYLCTKSPGKSVLGPILLFLCPYITGHIPANPKDIPFATSYILGLLLIYFFSVKKINPYLKVIILGIVFGLSQSLRMVGITLIMCAFIYELLYAKRKFIEILLEYFLVFIVSILTMVVFIPFLGVNLPANLIYLFSNSSGYKEWNGEIFYLGQYYKKLERPWHYLFVLGGVKIPLATLIFGVLGLISALGKSIKSKNQTLGMPLLVLAFFINVVIYLVAKPVVYNGIRHFLYLVCVFVLASSLYLINLNIKKGLIVITMLYYLFTAVRVIYLHPYEYVYFNEFTLGLKGAKNLFQLDYWGSSYKEASEYLKEYAQKNPSKKLKVFTCDNDFGVVYYSHFSFDLVPRPKDANITICDSFRDTVRKFDQPILYTVQREGVPLNFIRDRFIIKK